MFILAARIRGPEADSTGNHFGGLNSNALAQIRFGWRRYSGDGTAAKVVSHYSLGALAGFFHSATRFPTASQQSNGWMAGAFGDIGGTYLVTSQFGIGALATASLSYQNGVTKGSSGTKFRFRDWSIGGSALNASLVADAVLLADHALAIMTCGAALVGLPLARGQHVPDNGHGFSHFKAPPAWHAASISYARSRVQLSHQTIHVAEVHHGFVQALALALFLVPACMAAQDATAPEFHAGQWALQFGGNLDLATFGIMRFTGPRSALVLNLEVAGQFLKGTLIQSSVGVSDANDHTSFFAPASAGSPITPSAQESALSTASGSRAVTWISRTPSESALVRKAQRGSAGCWLRPGVPTGFLRTSASAAQGLSRRRISTPYDADRGRRYQRTQAARNRDLRPRCGAGARDLLLGFAR